MFTGNAKLYSSYLKFVFEVILRELYMSSTQTKNRAPDILWTNFALTNSLSNTNEVNLNSVTSLNFYGFLT